MTNLSSQNGDRLYNRIAVLRAERGLSRQELADALDVTIRPSGSSNAATTNPA